MSDHLGDYQRLPGLPRAAIEATIDWPRTNGPTEAVNLLIEKVRIGHGFRNFDNYRLRLLLRCGAQWRTPRTARVRGRQPRSIA